MFRHRASGPSPDQLPQDGMLFTEQFNRLDSYFRVYFKRCAKTDLYCGFLENWLKAIFVNSILLFVIAYFSMFPFLVFQIFQNRPPLAFLSFFVLLQLIRDS